MTASWLQWLENHSWAVTIRRSLWLYPGLEIIHLVGIVFVAGAAFMFDLRLLGFSKKIPVADLARHVLPWSRGGLLLIVPSGVLLFMTNATALGKDPTFWLKMSLLVLAGVNAAVFHWFTFQSSSAWRKSIAPPLAAKITAVFSIILWIAIIACGRLLAY